MKKEQSSTLLTQSVTRALAILSCFSDEEPELRVIDFTRKLALTQSNVSRLLNTMVSIGYVVRDESTGYYRLGPEIVSLGSIALNNYEIRKQAMPELYELEKRSGLDSNLAVIEGDSIFYLAHVDSYDSPRMYTFVGHRNPLHCTAIGKVLLAHLPLTEARAHLNKPLHAYTENTITEPEQIEKHLEAIKKQGYAMEWEELKLGRACIAAPIFDRTGKVAAGISVSGVVSKFKPEQVEVLKDILIEMANRISMRMGFITVGNKFI